MKLKTIRDIDVKGKRVLLRVDFNVPFDSEGNISDNTRIVAALPTIQYLLDNEAKVVIISHLGRPKGQRVNQLTLKHVAHELEQLLNKTVFFKNDCRGGLVRKLINAAETLFRTSARKLAFLFRRRV